MKVGLFGIYGVYNFGCEAIIRGAYKLINATVPYAEIIYFSYNYEFDITALRDLDINICPVVSQRTLFNRAKNKILTFMGRKQRVLYFDYESIINTVDVIFSIGGDIYTIPEVLRHQKEYPYYNPLVDFCDRAINAGKKVSVYGASVGPFGNYEKAVEYYRSNLGKYQMIICREEGSIAYLKGIGLTNICFFPDPAFQVKGDDKVEAKPQYIGLNLSPLSVNEIYGNYDEDNYRRLAKLLDRIVETTQKHLLFIPHVISPFEGDNDLLFMQCLLKLMKPENQLYVQFARSEGGFLGIKPSLKKCQLVISARMHCAINAVVENIPAIFLSYSQKSIGMCKYVYKSDEWVVNLKNAEKDVIPMLLRMLDCRNDIVEYLKKRNSEIDLYYEDNLNRIKELFDY